MTPGNILLISKWFHITKHLTALQSILVFILHLLTCSILICWLAMVSETDSCTGVTPTKRGIFWHCDWLTPQWLLMFSFWLALDGCKIYLNSWKYKSKYGFINNLGYNNTHKIQKTVHKEKTWLNSYDMIYQSK